MITSVQIYTNTSINWLYHKLGLQMESRDLSAFPNAVRLKPPKYYSPSFTRTYTDATKTDRAADKSVTNFEMFSAPKNQITISGMKMYSSVLKYPKYIAQNGEIQKQISRKQRRF